MFSMQFRLNKQSRFIMLTIVSVAMLVVSSIFLWPYFLRAETPAQSVISDPLSLAGVLLSVAGIIMGLVIFIVQLGLNDKTNQSLAQIEKINKSHEDQLNQIKEINKNHDDQLAQLKKISTAIDLYDKIDSNKKNAFFNERWVGIPKKYRCILPSWWEGRPIRSFASGDLFCVHAFQDMIGPDFLELELLDKHDKSIFEHKFMAGCDDDPIRTKLTDFFENKLTENCIFLCSPRANKALACIAPVGNPRTDYGKIKWFDPQKPEKPAFGRFGSIKLPIWFESIDEPKIGDTSSHDRDHCIRIRYADAPLSSPADPAYKTAHEKEMECKHSNPDVDAEQEDYAIIARLTANGFKIDNSLNIEPCSGIVSGFNNASDRRKIFIVAGIHEYGTWVAADVFRRLIMGGRTNLEKRWKKLSERKDVQSAIFGNDDFIMLIKGTFNSERMTVLNTPQVLKTWTRDIDQDVWSYGPSADIT